MSGLFGSITIKGNRLTDFAGQTSTVGIPIPYGFGKYPTDGNVIFAPMPPKEHVKKKKQGKGGVKTETYTYTLSYAIAFCEGPIYGYLTIKRNGKVVYTTDPNASVDDAAYSAKWAQKTTFYYGTNTQLPDSVIESYKGTGRVSAFRGLAYIVVEDDDVTDTSGAVPSYEAVVIASPPEVYITSRPYPNDMEVEAIEPIGNIVSGELKKLLITPPPEAVESGASIVEGEMRTLLIPYDAGKDAVETESVIVEGEMRQILKLTEMEKEAVESQASVISGSMKVALIQTEIPKEAVETGASVIDGSLGP